MSKPRFTLNSPAIKFSQLLITRSVALSLLRSDFSVKKLSIKKIEMAMAHAKPEKAKAWQSIYCSCGKCRKIDTEPTDENPPGFPSETFEHAWEMRGRLTDASVSKIRIRGITPAFINRLSRIENRNAQFFHRCEYFPTLVSALVALEWTSDKFIRRSEKKERSVPILEAIMARWQPSRTGIIWLPPLRVPGFRSYLVAVTKKNKLLSEEQASKRIQIYSQTLEETQLRLGREFISRHSLDSDLSPDGVVRYLLRLGLLKGQEIASKGAATKWAIDLISACTATISLIDASDSDKMFNRSKLQRIRSIISLARLLWSSDTKCDISGVARLIASIEELSTKSKEDANNVTDLLQLIVFGQTLLKGILSTLGVNLEDIEASIGVGLRKTPNKAMQLSLSCTQRRERFFPKILESAAYELDHYFRSRPVELEKIILELREIAKLFSPTNGSHYPVEKNTSIDDAYSELFTRYENNEFPNLRNILEELNNSTSDERFSPLAKSA